MSARRASGSGSPRTTAESGWPSHTPNVQAATMNVPTPTASMAYSGQCLAMDSPGCPLFARLLQQLGDEAGPPRLVAGADAGTAVAVEVFIEKHEVAPMRITGEALDAAVDWATPVRVAQEDPREPARQLGGDLGERHHVARARRELDLQLAAVEMIEALQRLDDEEVHWKPDRSPPVGVPSEQPARRFRRLVVDTVRVPLDVQDVRMLGVVTRQRANAVGREEFALVEHRQQYARQSVAVDEREQPSLAAVGGLARHQRAEIGTIVEKPPHAPLESRQSRQLLGLDHVG